MIDCFNRKVPKKGVLKKVILWECVFLIIKQANLENTEIEFKIGNEGLLLKPISNKLRKGWEQKIKKMQAKYSNQKDKGQLDDFLNHEDDIENWQW